MVKKVCLAFGVLLIYVAASSQSYKKIHQKAVLIDTHNDVLSSAVLDGKDISHKIPEGHSDLDSFKQGGVDVQFFSVFTGPDARNKEGVYKDANQEIDSLEIQRSFLLPFHHKHLQPGFQLFWHLRFSFQSHLHQIP